VNGSAGGLAAGDFRQRKEPAAKTAGVTKRRDAIGAFSFAAPL